MPVERGTFTTEQAVTFLEHAIIGDALIKEMAAQLPEKPQEQPVPMRAPYVVPRQQQIIRTAPWWQFWR